MKHFHGSKISGYVQIQIIGEHPEKFLQSCTQNGLMLWDVSKPRADCCTAKVMLQDVKKVRKLRSGTKYKIKFKSKYGLPFALKRFLNRKPLLISLILSIILFIVLSNMIWQVKITGVPEELENRIYSSLESYGIHPGAFKMRIASPNQIQEQLIHDIPELLWVGVDLQGTTYHLEGVEKLIVKDEEAKSPGHLIASKDAVIKSMYVKRGQPEVRVNDYVEKGTVLVSGAIEKTNTNPIDDEEENDKEYEFVAAEGEIIAVTWYKAEVTIPLKMESEILTGNVNQSYHVKVGNAILPLWPWKKENFANELIDTDATQLQILKWRLPIHFLEKRRHEKTLEQIEITKEEAVERGIEQAKNDLLLELGKDAQILSEKVLHETIERGKVKLSLYITAEENIAVEQPITQGD